MGIPVKFTLLLSEQQKGKDGILALLEGHVNRILRPDGILTIGGWEVADTLSALPAASNDATWSAWEARCRASRD
jgi:hypothetical protein